MIRLNPLPLKKRCQGLLQHALLPLWFHHSLHRDSPRRHDASP